MCVPFPHPPHPPHHTQSNTLALADAPNRHAHTHAAARTAASAVSCAAALTRIILALLLSQMTGIYCPLYGWLGFQVLPSQRCTPSQPGTLHPQPYSASAAVAETTGQRSAALRCCQRKPAIAHGCVPLILVAVAKHALPLQSTSTCTHLCSCVRGTSCPGLFAREVFP